MMLRAFVGGLVLAAGAGLSIGAATAADLPVRVSPPTVPPVAYVQPVYNWSGFYVGGHIGGGFADSS
jgi:outer membrane immunogenic protein